MEKRLLNVEELAQYIHSTPATIYTWVSMKKIPDNCRVGISRRLLFDKECIDRWIDSCRLL